MGILVETSSGTLQGVQEERHQEFRGIPYARPPIGALRFCAPQPPAGWDGVRDGSQFGASSIQGTSPVPGMAADGPLSEDCLYLNVYTPKADNAKRPVMFWVHGGGFTLGASNSPLYNGDPNHEGMDTWQIYDCESRATMVFGKESVCVDGPFEDERASWEMSG
jgi:para-nitrobenzyl esterase